MKSIFTAVALLAAVTTSPAFAQPAAAATDADAPVPALRHDSAFADYRRDEELPRADWREVNRIVDEAARKGGGHAGHGAAPAPAPAPGGGMPQGYMKHGDMKHGGMDHGAMHHGGMKHGGMDHGPHGSTK